MTYAKVLENHTLNYKWCDDVDQEYRDQLLSDGYKLVVDETDLTAELSEYQEFYNVWEELKDSIRLYTIIADNDPSKISDKIEELRAQLTKSDYKVTKNYETMMANIELEKKGLSLLPYDYDPIALRAERQPIRDQINELENLLTQNQTE